MPSITPTRRLLHGIFLKLVWILPSRNGRSKKLHLSRFQRKFQRVPKHHFEHNTVAPGRENMMVMKGEVNFKTQGKNFFFPIISGFQKKNQEEFQIHTKNVSHGWKMDANFWWIDRWILHFDKTTDFLSSREITELSDPRPIREMSSYLRATSRSMRS